MKTMGVALAVAGAVLALVDLAGTGRATAEPTGGDPKRGAEVFRAQCSTCHSVEAGRASPIGPHLGGVVGRRAASAPEFKYSPAFRQLDFQWTPARLDEYLQNPCNVAPGTPMGALVVPSVRNRQDVIAFLASTRPVDAQPAPPQDAPPAP